MSREASEKSKHVDTYSIKAYTLELREEAEKPDDISKVVDAAFEIRGSQ